MGVDLTRKKMLSGRHLTVLTDHFENYLVLRYKRVWIVNLWRWHVSKRRWRFGKGFFPGCSDPFLAEQEHAGRKVGCGRGWFEVLVRALSQPPWTLRDDSSPLGSRWIDLFYLFYVMLFFLEVVHIIPCNVMFHGREQLLGKGCFEPFPSWDELPTKFMESSQTQSFSLRQGKRNGRVGNF